MQKAKVCYQIIVSDSKQAGEKTLKMKTEEVLGGSVG